MFGLELAAAGLLHMAQAQPDVACNAGKAPKVIVKPSKSEIYYDFSRSQANLDGMDIDTVSPYGPGKETHVGGLMSGEIQVKNRVSYLIERYEGQGQACLHYDTIEVSIHIDPTIYVASDYKRGSCMHNAILDHEQKHIKVDRLIVNKYSERIGKAISLVLNKYGPTYGPVPMTQVEATQKKLHEYISQIVSKESERMNSERKVAQQNIDNLQEYERVQKLCPQDQRASR